MLYQRYIYNVAAVWGAYSVIGGSMKHETFIEIPVTVYYDLSPYRPPTRIDPEELGGIEITAVEFAADCCIQHTLDKSQINNLVDQIQEAIAAEYEGIE